MLVMPDSPKAIRKVLRMEAILSELAADKGITYEEIARRLNISYDTVRRDMHDPMFMRLVQRVLVNGMAITLMKVAEAMPAVIDKQIEIAVDGGKDILAIDQTNAARALKEILETLAKRVEALTDREEAPEASTATAHVLQVNIHGLHGDVPLQLGQSELVAQTDPRARTITVSDYETVTDD